MSYCAQCSELLQELEKARGVAVTSIALLGDALIALNRARYSEKPMADKIRAYLENLEISKDELESAYLKSRKSNCGF